VRGILRRVERPEDDAVAGVADLRVECPGWAGADAAVPDELRWREDMGTSRCSGALGWRRGSWQRRWRVMAERSGFFTGCWGRVECAR
jgi:hypothetical protein